MHIDVALTKQPDTVHDWLKRTSVAFVPGPGQTSLSEIFVTNLLNEFRALGHSVHEQPTDETDVLITTVPFGQPLSWRKSLFLTGRLRYQLSRLPAVFTIVPITPGQLEDQLVYLEKALVKDEPHPTDFIIPGLASNAYQVLYEQGRRGGPILALERWVQAQSKCIRVLLLVGEEEPLSVYHFDLVGAYPESKFTGDSAFYQDIVLRMVTSISTQDVTQHQITGDPIPKEVWGALATPPAMQNAARAMGERQFFTDTVHIHDLVNVPSVGDAVANQYSEGCFATWDPEIEALIVTVTGSARPVHKGSITEKDLAVIVGVRPDGEGALIRRVEGKQSDPPSSEAVEMAGMDTVLPRISLPTDMNGRSAAPVIRSKLHVHRGISAYHPEYVEFISMETPYYHYPVSCATEAQARGIIQAFSHSEALNNPDDPRQVVFTVLPTHGVVIAEKWAPGKAPFEVICDYVDQGRLVIDNRVPQGLLEFRPDGDAMILKSQ